MKRTENYAKIRFKAASVNEGFARVCAAAFASQADPTIEVISDIKTAVSEAVTKQQSYMPIRMKRGMSKWPFL